MREDSGVIGRLRLDVAVKHCTIFIIVADDPLSPVFSTSACFPWTGAAQLKLNPSKSVGDIAPLFF